MTTWRPARDALLRSALRGLSLSRARRRKFLLSASALLLAPTVARSQASNRRFVIGILTAEPDDNLQRDLRALGYAEGRNVTFEVRNTGGKSDRIDPLAADLVRQNVDLIVANYPAAVLGAKRATSSIPIVMMHTPDPVQLGVVASLARPGGNITGLTTVSVDLSIKQLELLKEAMPRASRVALVWNPDNPWHPVTVKGLRAGRQSLGVALQVLEVRGPDAFDAAFQAMASDHADAVLVLADPMTFAHRTQIAELAIQYGLPMMGSLREYADAGSLMSYWADKADLYRRTASYVDRILKGARPADLPIEQPTKFEFVVNLKTARTLGITIPQSVLLRADDVIPA